MRFVWWPTACALVLLALVPVPAAAQDGPPGPYVVDVRGVTANLPNDSGFFPEIPAETRIPSRAFGLDVGGHVYPLHIGPVRVGVGINVIRAWASAVTAVAPVLDGIPAEAIVTPPEIRGTFTAIAPQLSFNFGRAAGWSHLSLGLGLAEIEMRAIPVSAREERQTTGRVTAVNIGGGARWFLRPRLAIGFDVRFHRLGPTDAGESTPGTPATTLLTASIGFSIR